MQRTILLCLFLFIFVCSLLSEGDCAVYKTRKQEGDGRNAEQNDRNKKDNDDSCVEGSYPKKCGTVGQVFILLAAVFAPFVVLVCLIAICRNRC